MTGIGITSPTITAIDPAGSIGPILSGVADVIQAFSRLRSVSIVRPYKSCGRQLNYSNWLVQTVAEPWLPTVLDNGTGDRGTYA
jgi:hypothetical protein